MDSGEDCCMDQTRHIWLNYLWKDKKFTYPVVAPFEYPPKGKGNGQEWVVKGGLNLCLIGM